jgi:type II secretory pathway pseudopilin PulG
MKTKSRQSGFTLMEEAVVVAVIALLVVLGVPAVRALFKSIEAEGGTKSMISAALSSARAIAAREQHYAGVRFQNRYQQDGKGCQYMIFIVQDPKIMAYGFRAVEGMEPIKLPDSVGVMEDYNKEVRDTISPSDFNDTTTFSIVFSPSGKLVIHDVQTRNRNGQGDSPSYGDSLDDIFNKKAAVEGGIAMFYQDDYHSDGLDKEPSRNSFIIYDRDIFEKTNENSRYDDYLKDLEVIYINPYTGTMINK